MRVVTRARAATAAGIAAIMLAPAMVVGSQAHAGPNAWSQLSSGGELINIDEPAVTRSGKNLHAVWHEQTTDQKPSLRSRVVGGNGVPASSISTVTTGWNGLVRNPAITVSGGKPVVVFSGLRDGWPGALKSATLADGVSWTENAEALTQTEYAYTGNGTAAVDDAGVLAVATAASGPSVFVNRGTPAGTDVELAQAGSAIDVALARDRKTGQVWAAWHNLANPADPIGTKGIGVQQVYPTLGARTKAPGSTDAAGNAIVTDQRIALAARNAPDGGVWMAYAVGYPTARAIRVWKVGTSISRTINVGGNVRAVSLSAAPGGRLWLAWHERNSNTLRATRSDPTVTTFGAIRVVGPPARRGGATTVWNATSEGALGPLDFVITAGTGAGSDIQVWHLQLQAALTVQVAPVAIRSANGGNVLITVTDAGRPVAGATVAVLGRLYATNSVGQVGFVLPRRTAIGVKRITASRTGYFPGAANLRVT